jgi:hypothetical protein
MQRIIVDDYPSEAKDCPLAELELVENEYGLFERHKCKCSGGLCVISETRFDDFSPDYNVDSYIELAEEYGYDRQSYCRDYCPYLLDMVSILREFNKRIGS